MNDINWDPDRTSKPSKQSSNINLIISRKNFLTSPSSSLVRSWGGCQEGTGISKWSLPVIRVWPLEPSKNKSDMIDIFIDKIERHKRMIKTLVSDREQGICFRSWRQEQEHSDLSSVWFLWERREIRIIPEISYIHANIYVTAVAIHVLMFRKSHL
jgi:hypothetical protein